MRPLSTSLDTTFLAHSAATATTGVPLDLKGSDGRFELLLPSGSLDLSQASIAGHKTPVGALSLSITQVHGHVINQAILLGQYRFGVANRQGHPVSGIRLKQPATLLYHYQRYCPLIQSWKEVA